jgi:hypothetical protein
VIVPPQPKDASTRARRNRSSTATTLPASGSRPAPELPELEDASWHPMTVAWWRDVWASPMASEYVTADAHGLFRLAMLVNDFWSRPSKDMAAEIRLQEQRYGLSPLDRRRLEWTVEQVDEARDRGRQRREQQKGAKQPKAGSDPRSVLSVVS